MTLFLAVDQSTSATKALLFDDKGSVLDKASRDHAQLYPQPGYVEHDAGHIWQNTLDALRVIISRHQDQLEHIACLSITNQRETAVIFDKASGQPVHNALVWQCRRGAKLCDDLREAGHEATVKEKTGLPLDPYFSASKVSHLLRNNPALKAGLADGRYGLGTIDCYLIHRLTNGTTFATDHTNAARTLLFDICKLEWAEDLCALWDIPIEGLPETRDSSSHFGKTDLCGLLPRQIPICGVLGDSHASLIAHRCFRPGSTKVTFGTGSSIMMNAGPELRHASSGIVTTLAWTHQGKPVYAYEGIIIYSAATLAWLRTQLGLFNDFSETEELAKQLDDNGGVYLVPAFAGLGLPYWDASARGTLVGLSGHSDRRHLIRAGLESIAYQLRDALTAMQADSPFSIPMLHGDGGATKNAFLMQFTADLTRASLKVANMSECSALGACLMGMLGTGTIESMEAIAALPQDETLYSPLMDESMASALHAGWSAAVRKTLCP